MLRLLLGLLVALAGAFSASTAATGAATTAASAATYTYDSPSSARVDVDAFGVADASPAQLSDAREGSVSAIVEAHGTSTTPPARSVATKAGSADFVVDSRGTTIPTDPGRLRAGLEDSRAFQDVSTNPATSRKFVGVDDGDPIRIRVEKGHFDDPTFTGPPDPLHTIDHLHVERRLNGATGPWTEAWKIPYVWPF